MLNLPPIVSVGVVKVEDFLPIVVDAVNNPPKVLVSHHQVVKFAAIGVWSRYLATKTGSSLEVEGNVTLAISTGTKSGHVMLRGMSAQNIAVQVKHYPKPFFHPFIMSSNQSILFILSHQTQNADRRGCALFIEIIECLQNRPD